MKPIEFKVRIHAQLTPHPPTSRHRHVTSAHLTSQSRHIRPPHVTDTVLCHVLGGSHVHCYICANTAIQRIDLLTNTDSIQRSISLPILIPFSDRSPYQYWFHSAHRSPYQYWFHSAIDLLTNTDSIQRSISLPILIPFSDRSPYQYWFHSAIDLLTNTDSIQRSISLPILIPFSDRSPYQYWFHSVHRSPYQYWFHSAHRSPYQYWFHSAIDLLTNTDSIQRSISFPILIPFSDRSPYQYWFHSAIDLLTNTDSIQRSISLPILIPFSASISLPILNLKRAHSFPSYIWLLFHSIHLIKSLAFSLGCFSGDMSTRLSPSRPGSLIRNNVHLTAT